MDPEKDPQYYIDRYNNEPAYKAWFNRNYPDLTIYEAVGLEPPAEKKLAPFVDPNKDPQYYIDRYYNEPKYREWFDRNYPEWTIEEAVGLDSKETENTSEVEPHRILPKAEGLTLVEPQSSNFEIDSELAQVTLILVGIGISVTAIYGIKKRANRTSHKILEDDIHAKKRLFGSFLHNDPLEVIKCRLAHGEISIDEYYELRRALE